MVDKKALKELYKQSKPDMGLFTISFGPGAPVYVGFAADLRGVINGTRARLAGGMHVNARLQADFDQYGLDAMSIEVVEGLDYDKDESKTDYKEDLEVLQEMWLANYPDMLKVR